MALKTGICNNVTSCDLAYRKQPITTERSAFCCPECGQPLHKLESKLSEGRILMVIVRVVFVAFVFGAGGFLVGTRFTPLSMFTRTTPPPTPQHPVVPPINESPPIIPPPTMTPPATPQLATPPPTTPLALAPALTTPGTPDAKEEAADVKKQVLARIDALPKELVSKADRDKLYAAVDHARKMAKLATVQFDTGRTAPSPDAVAKLLERLDSAEVHQKLADPTVVLIILGYADFRGDDKGNLKLSTKRAENLLKILQSHGRLVNMMRSVGMGSSSLFGRRQLEKNRIAEAWLVLP